MNTYDNYTKLKRIRRENECLFEGVAFQCARQGKCKTEKNHLIQKSSYFRTNIT